MALLLSIVAPAHALTAVVVPIVSRSSGAPASEAITTAMRVELAKTANYDAVVPWSLRDGRGIDCFSDPVCMRQIAEEAGGDVVLAAVMDGGKDDPVRLYAFDRATGGLAARSVGSDSEGDIVGAVSAEVVSVVALAETGASEPRHVEPVVAVQASVAARQEPTPEPDPWSAQAPSRTSASAAVAAAPTSAPVPTPKKPSKSAATVLAEVEALPTAVLAAVAPVAAARLRKGPVSADGFRHPCTPAADLGPDRYARLSMVIFPVTVGPREGGEKVAYRGKAPGGDKVDGDEALVASVAEGLFAVDYPLGRFDAWLARNPADANEELSVPKASAAEREALACTDTAVVPRVSAWSVEPSKAKDGSVSGYEVKLTLVADVYERDGDALVRKHTLTARAPSMLDHTEDVVQAARAGTVDKVKGMVPGGSKKVDKAEEKLRKAISYLPKDQAAPVTMLVDQGELAISRVASAARPATVLPALGRGASLPALGLGWRSVEDDCYISPPDPKKSRYTERLLECAVFNRVRQVVRIVQLNTAKTDEFRLFAPATPGERPRVAEVPLGIEEGVHVGDGYYLLEDDRRVGYGRVQKLGAGGEGGVEDPSRVQVVWGRTEDPTTTRAREHPLLGIEVAAWGGFKPAGVQGGTINANGPELEFVEGDFTWAGALRFDVDLGRTAGWFDWYQTNRLEVSGLGDLGGNTELFGIEKRFLVAPRLYVRAGASAGVTGWSMPTGETCPGDDGEDRPVFAGDTTFAGDIGTGAIVFVVPSVLIRLDVNARLSPDTTTFTSKCGEDPFDDISLEIHNVGLSMGLSTGWVF